MGKVAEIAAKQIGRKIRGAKGVAAGLGVSEEVAQAIFMQGVIAAVEAINTREMLELVADPTVDGLSAK